MDGRPLLQEGNAAAWVILGGFFAIALAETFWPRRTLLLSLSRRWIHHGLLFGLNTLLASIVFRIGSVAFAVLAASSPYGLLNRGVPPYASRFLLGFLFLDLLHYWRHYLYHRAAWLWRVHQVHHGDPDFDLTIGFRFHPMELLLTQGLNLAAIALLAPPPAAVLAAELATLFQDLFEHGNLAIPAAVDRWLRLLLITPDMHRIHHSRSAPEQLANYGTIFPWWDRMFGTYLHDPAGPQDQIELGLEGVGAGPSMSLWASLRIPFLGPPPGEN